jgi:hypothetical protein
MTISNTSTISDIRTGDGAGRPRHSRQYRHRALCRPGGRSRRCRRSCDGSAYPDPEVAVLLVGDAFIAKPHVAARCFMIA